MDERIRSRFVHKVLTEEASRFHERQTVQIQNKTTERTGRLLRGRSYQVYGSDGSFEAQVVFSFPIEERFLDITHLGGSEKGRRRYLHNRPTMRMYNRVAERLMTEFTESMQEQLKAEIEEIRKKFLQGQV